MSVLKRTIPGKSPARRIAAERWQQYGKRDKLKYSRNILILIPLLFFNLCGIYGQRTIQGKVIDEDFNIAAGIKIYDNQENLIGETDWNGNFKVNIENDSNQLIFASVGTLGKSIFIPSDCNYIEVILLHLTLYHQKSHRKIDRLRKKEFERLPLLHKKAFEKRIFKNKKACFNQEFIPIKPELDKIRKQSRIKKKQIRRTFRKLEIGDTIKIPFSGSFGYDGTDRTSLIVWSSYTNETDFDCIIKCIITDKNRKKSGYNLICNIINLNECQYETIVHNDKELEKGDEIKHNMRYFKILTE